MLFLGHSLIVNVCCWRGPDLTLLLLPALLSFWMLLAPLELIDVLAWALSPSKVPDSVVVIHVMLLPCLTLLVCALAPHAPSEVLDSATFPRCVPLPPRQSVVACSNYSSRLLYLLISLCALALFAPSELPCSVCLAPSEVLDSVSFRLCVPLPPQQSVVACSNYSDVLALVC